MNPLAGLDSPPSARAGSPFRMDITPVRTNQVNLFFSPAQDDDDDNDEAAVEGTYVRKARQQVPETYTRKARPAIEEDDESEDERSVDPPSKRQRTSGPAPSTSGPQNAAARLAASRRALDPTSALSLFDDDPDDPAASAQHPATAGDPMGAFDPLRGPAGMMSGTAGGADNEATDKPKRTRPKLDVERLLGDRGFPALIKDAKRLRLRGKGHEAKDLAHLLSMYQMWTHQMFPRMAFTETVARVETLCHMKVVKSALSGYREKDKELRDALFRSPSPPRAGTIPQSAGESSIPANPANLAEPISRASAAREPDPEMDMEEEDYEAMIAAAEHEASAAQSAIVGGPAARDKAGMGQQENDDDEDFEAMIAAAEAEAEEAHRNAASMHRQAAAAADSGTGNGQSTGGIDEYGDDWAAMDALLDGGHDIGADL
ncbi:hypothetical protein NliqN6_3679 [Naganishia liquefaciens]|uniref:Chromosome segregation in meiosis protein n=1 Tax=Naganishia liquefaciens TaxID=104408 RepID=A0A8H3TU90_9TREE|nr:hypothetical protein NliqN6_3679 [Naganishia liquefaciens]